MSLPFGIEPVNQHARFVKMIYSIYSVLCYQYLSSVLIKQWLIVGLGWWFGILIVPLSNNPFHKGIRAGIQTTGTQSN